MSPAPLKAVAFNGERWIYKTMQDLADGFGFSVRDIQRHLKTLCDLGWLKREQLEQAVHAPVLVHLRRHRSVHRGQVLSGSRAWPDGQGTTRRAGSSLVPGEDTRTWAPRRWSKAPDSRHTPHAIPDAEETKRRRLREEAMVFPLQWSREPAQADDSAHSPCRQAPDGHRLKGIEDSRG